MKTQPCSLALRAVAVVSLLSAVGCASLPTSTTSPVGVPNAYGQSLANVVHSLATATPNTPAEFDARVDALAAVVPSLKPQAGLAKARYAAAYPSIVAGQHAVLTVESIAALFEGR